VPCPHAHRSRREFLGLLGVGLAVTLSGCGSSAQPAAAVPDAPDAGTPFGPAEGSLPLGGVKSPAEPTRLTGAPQIVHHGPAGTGAVALTVDDGFCADCVSGYVDFVRRTGIHLTFCPNGIYAHEWEPHAPVLRPLIEAGQIQLMNHTFDHKDLTVLAAAGVRAQLDRNEEWIGKTFGTSTRPYYRPPFGRHTAEVQAAAAKSGYRVMTLWNGSYSDSTLITPEFLMSQAERYLRPGNIVIGHANHPTVLGLFDQIEALIKQRGLRPVTLDEMFGTQRTHRKA
jgi:peptidoglycan/xylan/chitin deacetylase (PgdA/CDA1 family)